MNSYKVQVFINSDIFKVIQHRRRKFSKTVRPIDFAGFEATEDLQEMAAEHEDEEVDAVSDIDSDEDGMFFIKIIFIHKIICVF